MAPSGWGPIRLGAVCTKIGSGATPRGGSDVYLGNGPYALIRSQNIYNDGFHREGLAFIGEKHAAELSNVEVLEDDVLLNITGDSVARCCQVDKSVLPARVNQHVAIIRPDPRRLSARLLRYILVSREWQAKLLSWAGSGGTRAALTKGMIESFDVLAPEGIDEQNAIAGVLGSLDEKIELNGRMNESLEAMARAIFKSWFVDFDPVRAKAEGCQPAGMDAETAALFSDAFEESDTEQPSGWRTGGFLDIAELLSGGTPKTAEPAYWDGGIPWASAQDVSQCGSPFLIKTSRMITSRGVEESATQLIPALSTVVVARGATTGRHTMLGRPMAMNQTCYGLKAKAGEDYFLYCLFGSEVDGLVNAAHGSVFDTITTSTFRSSEFVVPPAEIRLRFNALTASVFERILANLEESRTLAALRHSLLPKLLSGEVRVPQAVRSEERPLPVAGKGGCVPPECEEADVKNGGEHDEAT